jgi:hypothetical protein
VKQQAILNAVSIKHSLIQSFKKACFDRTIAMKECSIKVKSYQREIILAEKLIGEKERKQ